MNRRVDALVIRRKCVLPAGVGQPQETRTLNKCRGAPALKVTEGNVRQELGFRPCGFYQPIQFLLGSAAVFVSRSKHLVHHTHCLVSGVHKERFKCFPKAN
jgi:hypothetical protein